MVFRAGGFAGGRNQDKLMLNHLLPDRRRRLWEVSLGSSISGCLLLRVRGLFEVVVVGPDLIPVTVSRAHRGLLSGRSTAGVGVKTVQSIQDEIT
jgi:hypothetical protein